MSSVKAGNKPHYTSPSLADKMVATAFPSPLKLSLTQEVYQSPKGNALKFDILISEPKNDLVKVTIPVHGPATSTNDSLEREKLVAERRMNIIEEKKNLLRTNEKITIVRTTLEKKIDEDIEQKRLQSEAKLKLVEENRVTKMKETVEKARQEYQKGLQMREEQQKKLQEKQRELEERNQKDMREAEEKRLNHLSEIKEKCKNHVEVAKQRAANKSSEPTTQT